MPRGLGDNPLKKERKTRRAAARTGLATVAPEPVPDDPASAIAPQWVHASSSSSRSYNDVFFMRRPDNFGAAANGTHEESQPEAEVAAAPIAAAEVPSSTSLPEVAASATTEIATPEAPAVAIDPSPPAVLETASQASVIEEPASPAPELETAQPETHPENDQQQEAKSGFFGRIFGRLRK